MMKLLRLIFFVTCGVMFVGLAVGQNEGNGSGFDSLASEFKKTKRTQDSIQLLIDKNRQLLQTDPSKKDEYSGNIISLEDQLYDVNSKLAKLTNRIIELDPKTARTLFESVSSGGGTTGPQSRTLVDNKVFRDNIKPADIALIKTSAVAESMMIAAKKDVLDKYQRLLTVKDQYDKSMNLKGIDSLLTEAKKIKEQISNAEENVANKWSAVYNAKIDNYMVVADKLDLDRLQLERIDEQSRMARRAEALAEEQIAPAIYAFEAQRDFAWQYEQLLANHMGLDLAKDSISKRISSVSNVEAFDCPRIELAPRSLVVYSKVITDGKYDFSGVNEIPEVVPPLKGVYYSIQVLLLQSKVKTMDSFRNARPLRVNRLSNGLYQYVAGGFKKYSEAVAEMNQLTRSGYKNQMVVVAWLDGQYTTALKAKAAQEAMEKANAGRFKLEIRTQNISLGASLRAIVDQFDEDTQIMRSQDGDKIVFTVMEFTNKSEAEELAEILRAKDKTEVEVIKID